MSTITYLNGRVDVPILKHEQLKSQLQDGIGLDAASAQIVDEIILKLLTLIHRIEYLQRKEDEYEAKALCNGSEHWPSDNEGYLKVNHGSGTTCPMHGKHHKMGSRLRIGVGRDPRDIAAVKQAMLDCAQYEKVKRELSEKGDALDLLKDRLKEAMGIYKRW